MHTLYYAPGACSLSPHIALREAGIPFELARVDFMRGKRLPDGRTLSDVNPKGYVPALVLPDGQLLTEGAAIVQYIADLAPASGLAPPHGTFERVRLQEWLVFIATELHKGLGPLFNPKAGDDFKAATIDKVASRLGEVTRALDNRAFLLGDFTVADGYALYALRTFAKMSGRELPSALVAYQQRIEARPAVRDALAAEGLA